MKLGEFVKKIRLEAVSEKEVKDLLEEYSIKVPEGILLRKLPDKVDLNYPLVLKVSDPGILHKSDVGGVITGISDYGSLCDSFSDMESRFHGKEFLLEEMASHGVEVIIGVISDPTFGHVIMLGMGGIYTELYKDTVFRLLPIDSNDADEMIESIGVRKFTTGFRNMKISREKLIGLLLTVSRLAGDIGGDMKQMDLNPVILTEDGATVVDAKMI